MAFTRVLVPTVAAAVALLCGATSAGAQSIVDPVLPGGHVRFSAAGDFTSWSRSYGTGTADLPFDADLLAPGLGRLEEALSGLTGAGPLRFSLGAPEALVSRSTIRIPLGLEVGIFDWLTVGATLPLVQTRVEAELDLSLPGDLGTNPVLASPESVNGFLGTLDQRRAEVATLVEFRCGTTPDTAECDEARAASDALAGAREALRSAYGSSPFFPASGSEGALALEAWAGELDAALAALGVSTLGPPPLAQAPLDAEGYDELTGAGGPLAGSPLNPGQSLWSPGDLALSASVRLLDVAARRDSLGAPGLRISAAATGTLRLPTGAPDSLDVFGEAGLSDGQRDMEVGGWLGIATRRVALRARGRYTRQERATFETRRSAAARVLGAAPVQVSADPGDMLSLEIEPALRLAPALSLGGLWRYRRRGAAATEVSGLVADGGGAQVRTPDIGFLPALGPLALPEWSAQEVGATLTYHTVDLGARDGSGFEVFLRITRVVSGDQGPAPRATRATMGLRLARRLWGS